MQLKRILPSPTPVHTALSMCCLATLSFKLVYNSTPGSALSAGLWMSGMRRHNAKLLLPDGGCDSNDGASIHTHASEVHLNHEYAPPHPCIRRSMRGCPRDLFILCSQADAHASCDTKITCYLPALSAEIAVTLKVPAQHHAERCCPAAACPG